MCGSSAHPRGHAAIARSAASEAPVSSRKQAKKQEPSPGTVRSFRPPARAPGGNSVSDCTESSCWACPSDTFVAWAGSFEAGASPPPPRNATSRLRAASGPRGRAQSWGCHRVPGRYTPSARTSPPRRTNCSSAATPVSSSRRSRTWYSSWRY